MTKILLEQKNGITLGNVISEWPIHDVILDMAHYEGTVLVEQELRMLCNQKTKYSPLSSIWDKLSDQAKWIIADVWLEIDQK